MYYLTKSNSYGIEIYTDNDCERLFPYKLVQRLLYGNGEYLTSEAPSFWLRDKTIAKSEDIEELKQIAVFAALED